MPLFKYLSIELFWYNRLSTEVDLAYRSGLATLLELKSQIRSKKSSQKSKFFYSFIQTYTGFVKSIYQRYRARTITVRAKLILYLNSEWKKYIKIFYLNNQYWNGSGFNWNISFFRYLRIKVSLEHDQL